MPHFTQVARKIKIMQVKICLSNMIMQVGMYWWVNFFSKVGCEVDIKSIQGASCTTIHLLYVELRVHIFGGIILNNRRLAFIYLFIFLHSPLKPPKIRLRKDFFAFIFVNFILLNSAYNWVEDRYRIVKLQTYLRNLRKNLNL